MRRVRTLFGVALTLVLELKASEARAQARPDVGYDRQVALIIGITDYRGQKKRLPNARLDAENFAALMLNDRKLSKENVITLYDRQATSRNIQNALARALRRAGQVERSLLIVYFAGHGESSGAGYLLAYPAKKGRFTRADKISMSELRAQAEESKNVRHQLYILASCFSGRVFRNDYEAIKSAEEQREFPSAASWMKENLKLRARYAITAGLAHQVISDGPEGLGSRFGSAVVQGLRKVPGEQYALADYNRDGCVAMDELSTYLSVKGSYRGRQDPYVAVLPDTGDQYGKVAFCDRFADPGALPQPPGPRRGGALEATRYRPKMVPISAGTFMMGSPENEPGRFDSETLHQVTLTQNFWLSESEVTQGQWAAVMGTRPSYFQGTRGGSDDHPVEQVSWYDALMYVNSLSEQEGLTACYRMKNCSPALRGGCTKISDGDCNSVGSCKVVERASDCMGYRLPTEAEWEYAARAGSKTALYSGPIQIKGLHNAPAVGRVGWYGGNSKVSRGGTDCSDWEEKEQAAKRCGTHPVKQKGKNRWGLYDMIGNVYEWVEDSYQSYPAEAVVNPGFTRWQGAGRVVIRGCGWFSDARICRAALRISDPPADRYGGVGIRLARSSLDP